MSGIVGIYNLDGRPVDPVELARVHQQIAHRGPDGGHCWRGGPVGLGHQLLCTTPESLREDQPLEDTDRTLVLTADARIDNRADLIRALGWTDRPAASLTDADLILGAYQKWGTDCPEHLLGAFAFAIWDARERRLFCARDHMGVKPFYYVHRPGRLFAFATEIKALLCQEAVPQEINEVRVAYYLARVLADKEITSFQGIQRLPAAHTLTVSQTNPPRLREYWSLDPERALHFGSEAEYVEGFQETFMEAVRCRLRTPSPTGIELSGGLDSSSVACVARECLDDKNSNEPLHAFSAVFPSLSNEQPQKVDEQPYRDAVTARPGITSHCMSLEAVSPFVDAERILWHVDQPCHIFNIYLDWSLLSEAHAQGIRVVLDGIEGDNAVSHGIGYLGELAHNAQWTSFARETLALADRCDLHAEKLARHYGFPHLAERAVQDQWSAFYRGASEITRYFDVSLFHLWWQYGFKPRIPDSIRAIWHRWRGHSPSQDPFERLLHPAFRTRIEFDERVRNLSSSTSAAFTERQAHYSALSHGATFQMLEEDNHVAAAHSVETRHPFYDVRLLEYCLALPPELKLRNGWTRRILREAMKGILPKTVRRRTDKSSLRPNFVRNLIRMEEIRIQRLFSEDADRIAPYVDMDVLQEAYHNEHAEVLWVGLQLAAWLRSQTDGRKHSSLPKKEHCTEAYASSSTLTTHILTP